MKKIILEIIMLSMVICALTACGKEKTDEEKILDVIDTYMNAIEKGDTEGYIKCYDPNIQQLAEGGINSVGNYFGISDAFDMGTALSSMFEEAFSETVKYSFSRNAVKTQKIENEKAVFEIEYNISINAEFLENKIEQAAVLKFKLVKRDGKWYIQNVDGGDTIPEQEEVPQKDAQDKENIDKETEIIENPTKNSGTDVGNEDIEGTRETLNLVYATDFSEGVAFVIYTEDKQRKAAAIDTGGNVLFDLAEKELFDPYDKWSSLDDMKYNKGILVKDDKIFDKNGNIIASPEKSGYEILLTENCDGYVLACQHTEAFSGDEYCLGVINNEGEWSVPLSTEHPILKKYRESHSSYEENIVYDFALTDILESEYLGNGILYEESWCWAYNFIDNQLIEDYIPQKKEPEAKKEVNYQLNGYSLSIVNNGTGADYLCLTDQNGEYAFEPIRMNGGTVYELSEKGFIYMSDKCRFYDYSGNCEELDIDTLNNFNDGLALARSKNSGWFYINTAGERIIG